MKRLSIYILLIFICNTLVMAQVPTPADPQSKPVALKGGTAHIGNGQVIENAIIGFDKGKITFVTSATSAPDMSGYDVKDISGQHVYPGMILPNSQLGLSEVSSVRATNDDDEVGSMAPNVRSVIAYNTDSKLPPTLRFHGILLAETTPTGGTISGTSSVMNLDGWNWEDAAMKIDVAVHMNWPRTITGRFDFATFSYKRETNKDYADDVLKVKTFINEARSYGQLAKKDLNLKFEAMQGLFDGSKVIMIHANGEKDIIDAVETAKEAGIKKVVIVAGTETVGVKEFLAENKIPVVLPPVHELPGSDDEDVYVTHKLPAILSKAGVKVALSHSGMLARARNLPFYVGTAIAYGVDKEEALKMVTSNTAEILGIDKEVGTLEKGKRATLFVTKGDPFDMMTNDLTHAFIDGKTIILKNEQEMLYERYSKKYGKQ